MVIALVISLVLWNLPFGALVLFPFKLLATWMHELSHGLVMMASGAGFDRMEVYRDTSGLAFAKHSVGSPARAAIAAAGYMGTPLFGALMLVWGQKRRGARVVVAVLGVLMAASAVLFIANSFGRIAIGAAAAACVGAAVLASERAPGMAVNFIAMQACINALLDIRVLFRSNLVVNGEVVGASDAHSMAHATFGTPSMWAAIWLAWSFALLYAALRLVYLSQERTLAVSDGVPDLAAAAPQPAAPPDPAASAQAEPLATSDEPSPAPVSG